jgi:hypothetical protein
VLETNVARARTADCGYNSGEGRNGGAIMIEAIGEVTEEGIRLPRQVLEECGYEPGRRMTVTKSDSGLLIRPSEATSAEIEKRALMYLLREAGDLVGIRIPRREAERWHVPVVLFPEGFPLGHLKFSLEGVLLPEESTSPQAMLEAANAA